MEVLYQGDDGNNVTIQLTSHPQPDPCTATVAFDNLVLKFSNEPKSFWMAAIKSP